MTAGGGRFDFDDGGTFCGGWEEGKANGHGVCTGPKGMGEYAGAWQYGFEISGIYTWPSGNSFEGQWFQGKRHGLGTETKGRWIYKGEWTQGFKGRYGVRASDNSGAKYEGTWTTGLQDGYGCETYADGGSYQGQWLRGMRHGYGVRQSVPYGLASHYRTNTLRDSLTSLRSENEDEQIVKTRDKKLDESRGGFVLKAKSDETPPQRRRSLFDRKGNSGGGSLRRTILSGLRLKKQKSTGDINDSPKRQSGSVRSTVSNISHISADSTQSGMTATSVYTDSNISFVSQDDITDVNVMEVYMGEWKNDKRSGFGISERSDGLKYSGEWYNNKKYGYGITTFKDGVREEGKYKNNVLISSGKKTKLFILRTSKLRERVDNAVLSSQRAAQIALQKSDIAKTRMENARAKMEQAEQVAEKAMQDCEIARLKANQFAPEFLQPGTEIMRKKAEGTLGHPTDMVNQYAQQNHTPNVYSQSVMTRSYEPPIQPMMHNPNLSPSPMHNTLADSRSKLGPPPGDDTGFGNVSYLDVDYGAKPLESPAQNIPSPSRTASFKIRRYSFLAGSRRGRGFSELFNSTILNDHFDHYVGTQRDDSGLGRELIVIGDPGEFTNGDEKVYMDDPSPDSGVSELLEEESKMRAALHRRRTLPSIVKRDPEPNLNPAALPNKVPAHSNENISNKAIAETIVIEDGIRKRVHAENRHNPVRKQGAILPKESMIESLKDVNSVGKRGSLPDISAIKENCSVMPRHEAYKLSSARRDEIRRLQEIDERRKQGDVTVILGDIKDWCQQRQLLVLVIALNVSLATMFFNLLS